jgi:hypothetical protein
VKQLNFGEARAVPVLNRADAAYIAMRAAELRTIDAPDNTKPYPPIGIGSRVKYTREFLKSILEPPTGRLWALESTVIAMGSRWLTILRDGDDDAMSVLPCNVQHIETPTVDAQSAADRGYAVVFGFEKRWDKREAEMLFRDELKSRGL